ncbi:MAG TPA: pilus assembly protein N-terminal domain-containing protein [Terriglobia bacterium]|nr:pilus assembly protein N-terminal domain-containing protein [Terriglobia bacterium]
MKILPRTRVLVLVCTLACLLAGGNCFAQGVPASTEAQPLHILVGKSVIINLQTRLTRVLASNPTVLETLVTSPTQLVVEAKSAGNSSLILWDESGNSRMLDVHVDLDLSGLRTAIQDAYPHDSIQVQAEQGRILLSGTVESQAAVDDLTKMAGVYSKDIVSSLTTVLTPQRQILLEVKFAEVDRTKLDEVGLNLFSTGATNTIGVIGTQQFGPITGQGQGTQLTAGGTTLSLSSLLNLFLFRPDINLGMTLQDLQQKSILQILAEPNLLAMDGKKASFLAGGEFPFPVVQGGANVGAVTIQFRPFGVKLDFTGHIGSDNTIHLQVAPEVSTLDFSNAVTISGFTVPALSTRRAETEIELRDGQSFGIAGLLDQRAQAQLSKMPGIGDLPILGQLFRSRSIKKDRTELIVIVTPHIADPVKSGLQMTTTPKLIVPMMNAPRYDSDLPGHKELENPSTQPVPKKEQ